MARNIPLPRDTGKRLTLAEQLDGLHQLPETQQWEVIQRIEKESEDYRGFRYHAPSTQKRQDHHRTMYTNFMLFKARKQLDDFSESELEEFLFSRDHQQLFRDLRQFLIYVYQVTHPRSKLTGQRISYRVLGHYRDSLLFWAKRSFFLNNTEPPKAGILYYQCTEAMRAVMNAYPDPKFKTLQKSYLGLAELRELFDEEMLHNTSVEYAEQHWAAWCIARVTACRPGSICASKLSENPPLKWKDLGFSVGDEPGQFTLVVKFENIHIKRQIDPEVQAKRAQDDRLHIYLESPQPRNLIFSPAHRLLVIAIRRGYLDGIETVTDLMKCTRQHIKIKGQHLNEPLFFRGLPKGEGVDRSHPLTASALSEYIKTRAHRLGWNFSIMGMVAIRRRSLTDIVSRVGLEQARRIAGHSPDSTTLERYYLYVSPMFDQTGALMDQDISNTGFSEQYRRRWAPLALGKIEDERIRRTRGAALRTMTDRLVLADENPPDGDLDILGRKAYRKRMRRYAHRALLEYERAESEREITQDALRDRQDALEASTFAESVLKRAIELQRSTTSNEDGDEEYPDWDGFENGDDNDDDGNALDEITIVDDDIEVTASRSSSNHITIEPETEIADSAGVDIDGNDLPYVDMATAFMEMLLDNSLNTSTMWSDIRDKTCALCQVDETVPSERRAREYQSQSHLDNHVNGGYHTLQFKFQRGAEIRKAAHPEGKYSCPYCDEAAEDRAAFFKERGLQAPKNEFSTHTKLSHHVFTSTETTDGKKHDELKDLGGWYDDDFYHKTSEQTRIKARQAGHRILRAAGVKLVKQRLVKGGVEQYANFPGVVRGFNDNIPFRFTGSIKRSLELMTFDNIPPKFVNVVIPGTRPLGTIPESFMSGMTISSKLMEHNTKKTSTSAQRLVSWSTPSRPEHTQQRTRPGDDEGEPINIPSDEEDEQQEDDGDMAMHD